MREFTILANRAEDPHRPVAIVQVFKDSGDVSFTRASGRTPTGRRVSIALSGDNRLFAVTMQAKTKQDAVVAAVTSNSLGHFPSGVIWTDGRNNRSVEITPQATVVSRRPRYVRETPLTSTAYGRA